MNANAAKRRGRPPKYLKTQPEPVKLELPNPCGCREIDDDVGPVYRQCCGQILAEQWRVPDLSCAGYIVAFRCPCCGKYWEERICGD